jgi:hypothetical protein
MGDYTNRPEGVEPEKWGYSDDLEPDLPMGISCLAVIVFLIGFLIWGAAKIIHL